MVAVIDDLAYRPRAAARDLNLRAPEAIALMVTDLANTFFSNLADRVVWEARARGLKVILMTTHEDPYLEAQLLETLRGRFVGGVIATPTGGNTEKWQRISDMGIEIVFVDRLIPELNFIDTVSIGNVGSARTATEFLLELGHQRIGFISGPINTSTGSARVEGYKTALEKYHVDFEPMLVQYVSFRGNAGADATTSLIRLAPRPTAIIIANTAQVPNAMRRLEHSGLRVPEELSIIAFDDNPWTDVISPPLTVTRQPVEMLAVHSLELLIARMQGAIPSESRHIEVDAEFVVRASCAPFKGDN